MAAEGAAPPQKQIGEGSVIFVCGVMLIDTISFGIIIPVLPDFLASMTHSSVSDATRIGGYLVVIFAALQFICGPIIGNLSDRFGRRPILLGSMAAFAANYLLMGAATNLWMLFIGRAISGVAGATYGPANAYVADITPPERRAQRFALVGAAFGIGFILGPALGGLVGHFSPRAPFFVAAAMAGVNFLFGLFVLPESLPRARRRPFDWRRANPVAALSGLQRNRELLPIVACIFLFTFAFQVYPTTWSYFASLKFGWGPGALGAALAYSGLLMALMQGAMTGRIVRALGERRAVMLGMGSAMLGMICNAFSVYGWQAYACSTLGCLQGLSGAGMNAIATSRVQADRQGELQGAIASLNGIGLIISPFILTQTLSFFTGPHAPMRFAGAAFVVSALITAAALTLFIFATRHFQRLGPRAAT